MIAQAKRNARRQKSSATFAVAGLSQLPGRLPPADVVVAASLRAVMPDPGSALRELWRSVAPGGRC
jgi:hypothetical protein